MWWRRWAEAIPVGAMPRSSGGVGFLTAVDRAMWEAVWPGAETVRREVGPSCTPVRRVTAQQHPNASASRMAQTGVGLFCSAGPNVYACGKGMSPTASLRLFSLLRFSPSSGPAAAPKSPPHFLVPPSKGEATTASARRRLLAARRSRAFFSVRALFHSSDSCSPSSGG